MASHRKNNVVVTITYEFPILPSPAPFASKTEKDFCRLFSAGLSMLHGMSMYSSPWTWLRPFDTRHR